uniref:G-rich RNA sequence binding factor 1 n=1 Tax=Bos mutus grunniens TaxID=30521 RepID=A0A8B9YSS0_BOSMU
KNRRRVVPVPGPSLPAGSHAPRAETGRSRELSSASSRLAAAPGAGGACAWPPLPGPGFHFLSAGAAAAAAFRPRAASGVHGRDALGARGAAPRLRLQLQQLPAHRRRLPSFYSTAGSFPSGVSGRRRLLLLLGAAAAAASQTRGFQSGPVTAGRLAGPPTAAASAAAAAAAASYPALRAPLLPQSLAAAAAGPARGYSQESKTTYLEDLPPLPEYELPPSKLGEEVDDVYLIRAQGLPWSCTVEDVLSFFSDCRIRNGENGIHFLLNRDGKRRGDALIEMESEQDVQKALEKHRMYMGQRYVEGLNIVDITFVMDYRGRRKTGEAYVQFEEPEMASQALLKHREEIGNRYIEIFPSRRNEVRTHVGSHKGKKIASSPTAKYITEPEMVFEEHEVNEDIRPMTAFESEKEIELPKEMSEKIPEAVDFGTTSSLHFVHMRGLPFQANAQDIINFFAPLKPVRITMEYSSSGKATGEADVHFDTHEDAVAAMLKDRSHVHHRYIELFLNSCPKGK